MPSRWVRMSRSWPATGRSAVRCWAPTPARPSVRARREGRGLETALDVGAFGLSSGLIYAPGMHATPGEMVVLASVAAARGALYATHMRNESAGLFEALDEAIETARAAGEGARLQVSHLKCGASAIWGRAGEAVARLEMARAAGLDVAADQYPYTAAATTSPRSCRRRCSPSAWTGVHGPGRSRGPRARLGEMETGISGWENVAVDPGWGGIAISFSASHPEWSGRTPRGPRRRDGAPAGRRCVRPADRRPARRLHRHRVHERADVEAIMAVPWIAVCTDAEGRRPGHPILDAGRPHPRTYGSTARVLSRYVRIAERWGSRLRSQS